MSRFPYQFFDEFVFRTPLFSLSNFHDKVSTFEIDENEVMAICRNPVFQEAIYLASPFLYKELIQWLNSERKFSQKKYQKLKATILKYYRMSTRCTPFGLFSEVGLGHFTNEIKQHYDSNLEKVRETRLDMHFLVSLTDHLLTLPEISDKLLFFPNNTIFQVGNKIRFIEYESSSEEREYIISSAPTSRELLQILDFSKPGKTLGEIISTLVNEEISFNEAQEFIEELIDNHVLKSELDPNVTGNDFLSVIISTLEKFGVPKYVNILAEIQEKLKEIDKKTGNLVSQYVELEDRIKTLNVEYKSNHLFQADLYYDDSLELDAFWKKELKSGITFLNKITLIQKETHLEKFKKAFYERFETQEVSLGFALDTELGIGYRQDVMTKGLHPYIGDLELLLSKEEKKLKIELNPVEQILNEKLQDALIMRQYEIELLDKDFEKFEVNWEDLPDTISFMAEIISEKNEKKLFLNGGGGCSAANLLSRFSSEKAELHELVKVITEIEEKSNPDCILAEIIHLPEARIGNLIRRPILRKYEIPYLGKSLLPDEDQIPIEDLYISLKKNRMVLRSKKLNKEVKPYLTNTHHYSANPLPIYHFLCDLYSQNSRLGVYFSWGNLKNIYHFLPRAKYKNVILSKASWKITNKEIKEFLLLIDNRDSLFSELKIWRNVKQIPQWIQWIKSDNKLTINLENYDLVKMFFDSVKNEEYIFIEEFLYDENDDFKREFIFPMYKVE